MIYIIIFIFGSTIGSFLNVCIYRIPRHISLLYPKSHCSVCKNPIKFYDNIPILSYIILYGRCRICNNKISLRYPFVELISGILALLIYLKYGMSAEFFLYLFFSYLLIIIFFIDLDYMIIPNTLNIIIVTSGIILSGIFTIGITSSIIGAFVGFVVMYTIAFFGLKAFKKEALGGGDIKLTSGIGAFLGIKGVFFSILLSSILGSIVGLSLIALKQNSFKNHIPYAPFLVISAITYIFIGKEILFKIYGF